MKLYNTKAVIGIAILINSTLANQLLLDENRNSLVCEGMYSKADWGGPISPYIEITMNRLGDQIYDPKIHNSETSVEKVKVNYALFEYKDLNHLGKVYEKTGRRKYICDDVAISAGLCETLDYGQFLFSGDLLNTTVRISEIDRLGSANLSYPILRTGYYCLSTFLPGNSIYRGKVDFQNAFGQLSGSKIPELPAYGILTLAYAVTFGFFAFQFFKRRNQNQILPLQRYLGAMLGLLMFETLVVWSYYDLVNRTIGKSWFVNAYAVFISILSSVKVTLCLYLLLLVSLGYGVVVMKLPKKTMFKSKILAVCHFTATMIYLLGQYLTNSGSSFSSGSNVGEAGTKSSLLQMGIYVPVTITLCLYYVVILTSMRETTAKLHKQRQVIKLRLLENLFNLAVMSWVFAFSALFFPVIFFFSYSNQDGLESRWKYWFFFSDFWPSLAFYVIFLGVSWLWRPTETSYMLAVSQQLSSTSDEPDEGNPTGDFQNGHEFELDDISLMSHSDEETQQTRRDSFDLESHPAPPNAPPHYKEVVEEPLEHASNTLFELDDEDHPGDSQTETAESDTRLK